MSLPDIVKASETIASSWDKDDHDQIAALKKAGFSEGQAWRLLELLPSAFSRPVLEELGITRFSPVVSVSLSDGSKVSARLSDQPEYVAGLEAARLHQKNGLLNHDVFKQIAASSAETDAVNKALNDGEDVLGSTIGPVVLHGIQAAKFLIR